MQEQCHLGAVNWWLLYGRYHATCHCCMAMIYRGMGRQVRPVEMAVSGVIKALLFVPCIGESALVVIVFVFCGVNDRTFPSQPNVRTRRSCPVWHVSPQQGLLAAQ